MRKIKALMVRYWEPVAYIAAGIVTTAVNYAVYSVLTVCFGLGITLSNTISWAVAVLTAFFSNKLVVFQSRDWAAKTVFREGGMFIGGRLLSGVITIGLVPLLMRLGITQSVLGIPGFAAKFAAECVGQVLNYILGKYAVFRT